MTRLLVLTALAVLALPVADGWAARNVEVPRAAQGDGQVPEDRKDLGRLKGNKGDQQYAIPASVDLRRYRSVIFWCVPFSQTLARANLVRS
jgi:hypothetical protein